MTARFIEDSEVFHRLYVEHPIPHSRVSSLWTEIFKTYFFQKEGFTFEPEYRLPDGREADVAVVYEPRGGRPKHPVVAVIESKPTEGEESWDSAKRQVIDYCQQGKRAKKTLAVVAKGIKFLMFVVQGSQMPSDLLWAELGKNNDGTPHTKGDPYDVWENNLALERVLLELKPDILKGDYTE